MLLVSRLPGLLLPLLWWMIPLPTFNQTTADHFTQTIHHVWLLFSVQHLRTQRCFKMRRVQLGEIICSGLKTWTHRFKRFICFKMSVKQRYWLCVCLVWRLTRRTRREDEPHLLSMITQTLRNLPLLGQTIPLPTFNQTNADHCTRTIQHVWLLFSLRKLKHWCWKLRRGQFGETTSCGPKTWTYRFKRLICFKMSIKYYRFWLHICVHVQISVQSGSHSEGHDGPDVSRLHRTW